MQEKQIRRNRIHKRIRSKILGTKERPRLCVFKSQKHIYAQLINDESAKVLASASDMKIKSRSGVSVSQKTLATLKKGNKVSKAIEVGKLIAKEAIGKKIEKVVFDRGGFVFHGRVKAVADGAREGGLKF